jgi:uncharacterized protein YndB with AHSA1/START domain
MPEPNAIRWPERYHPSRCPIRVRNELAIDAPLATVWAWLVRASLWPRWYPNAANVRFLEGAPPDLALATRFQWKTFGVTIRSTVREFVPCERIAWDAQALGLDVYHAWLLHETPAGCHVLTEETQHGVLARAGKLLMPGRMHRYHQIWLEGLREQARGGMPPD